MNSKLNTRPVFENLLLACSVLGSLTCLLACQAPKTQESQVASPVRIAWPKADRQAIRDTELPPFELASGKIQGSGKFSSLFWLDFEGSEVSASESFIVKKTGRSTVPIPTFLPGDIGSTRDAGELKEEIGKSLVTFFPGVAITFTQKRPETGIFSRVHIGGDNFTGQAGVLGISPLDLGNRSGNDILFIFPKVLGVGGDPEAKTVQLIHAIAHEIAHSLGARHIENQRSLMRTSVGLEADSFNLSGPVVGTPSEIENSLDILLHSVGSQNASQGSQSLPEIVDLDAFSTGDVIQYTVISQKNILQNPDQSLADSTYVWDVDGVRTNGTSVLMRFDDHHDHSLDLTVSNKTGSSRLFPFIVGRGL